MVFVHRGRGSTEAGGAKGLEVVKCKYFLKLMYLRWVKGLGFGIMCKTK